ncbi:hypothetical protein TNCV_1076181 [Trichonephila clavipes]|nr:hypothetical protein TNCV_1076181 [Trichonephila clavipes]
MNLQTNFLDELSLSVTVQIYSRAISDRPSCHETKASVENDTLVKKLMLRTSTTHQHEKLEPRLPLNICHVPVDVGTGGFQ